MPTLKSWAARTGLFNFHEAKISWVEQKYYAAHEIMDIPPYPFPAFDRGERRESSLVLNGMYSLVRLF